MTNDDRLFGDRLQLFDYAARTSVAEACRVFGVHRSTLLRAALGAGRAEEARPRSTGRRGRLRFSAGLSSNIRPARCQRVRSG